MPQAVKRTPGKLAATRAVEGASTTPNRSRLRFPYLPLLPKRHADQRPHSANDRRHTSQASSESASMSPMPCPSWVKGFIAIGTVDTSVDIYRYGRILMQP